MAERREARARFVSPCGRGAECAVRGRAIPVGAPIVVLDGKAFHASCEPSTRVVDAIVAKAARTVAQVDRLEAAGLASAEDIADREFARALLA